MSEMNSLPGLFQPSIFFMHAGLILERRESARQMNWRIAAQSASSIQDLLAATVKLKGVHYSSRLYVLSRPIHGGMFVFCVKILRPGDSEGWGALESEETGSNNMSSCSSFWVFIWQMHRVALRIILLRCGYHPTQQSLQYGDSNKCLRWHAHGVF